MKKEQFAALLRQHVRDDKLIEWYDLSPNAGSTLGPDVMEEIISASNDLDDFGRRYDAAYQAMVVELAELKAQTKKLKAQTKKARAETRRLEREIDTLRRVTGESITPVLQSASESGAFPRLCAN